MKIPSLVLSALVLSTLLHGQGGRDWRTYLGDEALKIARRIRAGVNFGHRPTSVAEVAVQALRESREQFRELAKRYSR